MKLSLFNAWKSSSTRRKAARRHLRFLRSELKQQTRLILLLARPVRRVLRT